MTKRAQQVSEERFLSVRLGPHHAVALSATKPPHALVLEFEGNQWVLYFLDASGKIASSQFPGSLEAAFAFATEQFGIRASEWVEDSAN
jgi:hypothetical protein